MGFEVQASDRSSGSIENLIVTDYANDHPWRLTYFILNSEGESGDTRQVMLAPHWIQSIDTETKTITAGFNSGTIRCSPAFDPKTLEYAT